MRSSVAFSRYNPFRRPDWRMERVLGMVDRLTNNPGRSTSRDDEYVKGLRNFILRYRNAGDDRTREILASENPGLYFAYQIYDHRYETGGQNMATMIEARILAAQPDEQIANELQTLPEAIEWYEAIFFSVRDRLQSHDWIINHVLIPSLSSGAEQATVQQQQSNTLLSSVPLHRMTAPFFDATLKFFAYFGGNHILDYVLTGFRRGNLAYSSDEIVSWFDGHFSHRLRHRSASAVSVFQVEPENVMRLFDMHIKLIEIERNTHTAENKQDQLHRAMSSFLTEIPWAVGRAGEALVAGTGLAPYDDFAAEPRDEECQLLSIGEIPSTIKGVELLELPKPRRTGQEAQPDAEDIKQGS